MKIKYFLSDLTCHDHLVNIDVMILADNIKIHQTSLKSQLLQLLQDDPAVVLDLDTHGSNGPGAHLDNLISGHLQVLQHYIKQYVRLKSRACDRVNTTNVKYKNIET